jgi:alpha-2-macroglobulin
MTKRNLLWAAGAILLLALLYGVSLDVPTPPAESLTVQATPVDTGPQVVAQDPVQGEVLSLSPTLQITFDRDMDPVKTAAAWSFSGPDGRSIPGQVAWKGPRDFTFRPYAKLIPATEYTGVFSTAAASVNGIAPVQKLELDFTTLEGLKVGQVFPAPDAEGVDLKTNITVIFNHPVAPLEVTEEQSNLPQPLEFTPPVSGHGQWANSSVYVFKPDSALPGGARYTVQVAAGLKDLEGNQLDSTYLWQFSTTPPAIDHFDLQNGPENPASPVSNVRLGQAFLVTFLQPMDQASTAAAVTLLNRETGQHWPVRLSWNTDSTVLSVVPAKNYDIASFYSLEIATSAHALGGGNLKDGLDVQFSTVSLPRIESVLPKPDDQAADLDSSISIQFASPMNVDTLKSRVQVSPPAPNLQWYYDDYDTTYHAYGLAPGTSYVVRILPGMQDLYGNAIQDGYSFGFKTADLSADARLVVPWTPLVYRANGPQEVFFEYTNLTSATISLYSIGGDDFAELMNTSSSSGRGFILSHLVAAQAPVREWAPDIPGTWNAVNRLDLQLQDAGGGPLKPGFYALTVRGAPLQYDQDYYQIAIFAVATDNITLKTTDSEALAWVTDLESGKPDAGVPVTFYDTNDNSLGSSVTDANGLAYLAGLQGPAIAKVEGAGRAAFTAHDWGSGVSVGDYGPQEYYYGKTSGPFAYLYTDRPVYRPGQQVYFKGILRENDDLHYSLPTGKDIFVTIGNDSGQQVYAQSLPLSAMGTFSAAFSLASDAPLGTYSLSVADSQQGTAYQSISFSVADYRKPEFQVTVGPEQTDILAGEKLNVKVNATYYSGGNVPGAKVDWFADAAPYFFTPSDAYSQYSFTDQDRDQYYFSPPQTVPAGPLVNGSGVTDANGNLLIGNSLDLGQAKTDQQLTFSANVTDVSGSLVSGQSSIIVHQSLWYAGVRAEDYLGQQGQAQPFDVVVVDWNSKPVPGQSVTVKFVRRQWMSVQKQDSQGMLSWDTSVKDVPVSQVHLVTGPDGTARTSFTPPAGGDYKAIVSVRDTQGHLQQSSEFIWVTSAQYIPWQQTNDRSFQVIADKSTYSPGDTARLLIAQPFQGEVYALVTYERGHIYQKDVVLLHGNSTVYNLPVTSDMAPAAYISVVVVQGATSTAPPDFKMGITRLNVDTSHQRLSVSVSPDKPSAGPGDTVTYTVHTADYSGKPVSADVSLAVVDKAALALAPANSGPMLESFYSQQALSVQTAIGLVASADDFNSQYRKSLNLGQGSGGGGGGNSLGIITVRQDFKDTAFFKAELTTDANGNAQVSVKLPENLTTWVADVRAVTGDTEVGQASAEMVATKPLFLQLQAPRFFVVGDQARIGALVFNNTRSALEADVSLAAQGVQLVTPAAQHVNVAAGSQAYVTWDLNVDPDATRVDLTATAVSGSYTDSSKPALGTLSAQGIPVYSFAALENVGTSGIMQDANTVTEGIQLPVGQAYTDAHLSVDLSPSLTASLKDSLTYLQDFQYLCQEQTVSRFLPNVLTTRALKLSGIPAITLQSDLDQNVNSALQRLYAKQLSDGGWNWWDGTVSDPQTTAYVVLGLIEAQKSGYPISAGVLANGIAYLHQNLPALDSNAAYWEYNRQAFMMYVLARGRQLGAGQPNSLYQHRDSLSWYGKAYLVHTLFILNPKDPRISSLMSDLAGGAVLSGSSAHWSEKGVPDYWNWNTDIRSTAIVLDAFVDIDPKNPLNVEAVRWLMGARAGGDHWYSTQDTVWSLMALTDWMTASQEFQANYPYTVTLNGNLLQQGTMNKGNLAETVQLQVQLKDLLKDELNQLVITRGAGTGNLYYEAYLTTTFPAQSVPPLDRGISLLRQYFTLDDAKHPLTQFHAGDLVRVRLTMVVSSDMHYVVVNDPLPAGLEAIDTSIQTDTQVPEAYTLQDYDQRGFGWWYFDHTELRDDRVVLSSDYLTAGTYVFTYLARASTVGTFNVMPPNASEFYFPDVGGRGAGTTVTVLP